MIQLFNNPMITNPSQNILEDKMKRIAIIVLSVLVFAVTTFAGEIGVIRQFSQLRPVFNKFKVDANHYGWDLDNDGAFDDAVIAVVIDSLDTIRVYDPVNKIVVWEWDFSSVRTETVDNNETITIHGYVPFGGMLHAIVAYGIVDAADYTLWRTVLVNTVTNEITYNDAGRPLAILELPAGRPVVLSYVEQDNIYTVIGEVNGYSSAGTISNDFQQRVFGSLGDYRLDLKFQSAPGLRLAYDPDLFDPPGDTDLDGDSHLDIPMLTADSSGVSGMVVRGGDSLNVLWQFPFPEEHKANILKGFHGFVDANGDGQKEMIAGDNLTVTLDGSVHTIAENFQILDVNDVDGDSLEDIIGLNTVDSTIVVYGLGNPTAVSVYDPAEIHFRLFQNYPNPFNPSTSISFTLQISGFTTLKIYDVLGREVATLVNENLEAGVHHQRMLDASKLSSGVYYYALQSGGKREIKKMLMVK
jgi:hypothetical protein